MKMPFLYYIIGWVFLGVTGCSFQLDKAIKERNKRGEGHLSKLEDENVILII